MFHKNEMSVLGEAKAK